MDWNIKPIVWTLPSYLKDTADFLIKLENVYVSETDLLCTMHVTSLYTNIPHEMGLCALEGYLNSRETDQPPAKFLWELAHRVLTINYFKFEVTLRLFPFYSL